MKKQAIKQELENLDSPTLAKWQGTAQEWSMPDDYLTHLANEVITQSVEENSPIIKRLNRSQLLKIAAAILFLLVGIGSFLNIQPKEASLPLANLNTISTEDIQTYVLDNIDDFGIELLEKYAQESSIYTPLQLDDYMDSYDSFDENNETNLF